MTWMLVFPASAGMNRPIRSSAACCACVPRERGDEPTIKAYRLADLQCSPRARG